MAGKPRKHAPAFDQIAALKAKQADLLRQIEEAQEREGVKLAKLARSIGLFDSDVSNEELKLGLEHAMALAAERANGRKSDDGLTDESGERVVSNEAADAMA